MHTVLNFGEKEKKEVLKFLQRHEELAVNSQYEEFRCRIAENNATLYTSGKLVIQGKSADKVKERLLREVKLEDRLVLGIDETGRGEDYGPFVIAGVLGYTSKLRELRDSKKIKGKMLEAKAKIVKENAMGVKSISIASSEIDVLRETGVNLNQMEANAINKIIEHFEKTGKKFSIIVDGAKMRGINEKAGFIPKADDKIVQVGAASVIAKMVREKSTDNGKRKTWGKTLT